MKLLITGGTGFFGKAILRDLTELRAKNTEDFRYKVTVLTRSPESFISKYPEFSSLSWLNFHKGDIEDAISLAPLGSFTHILHAAADSTDTSQLSPLQRYDQIVSGTRNLLDMAVACGAQRFLYISSGGVYGSQPPHFDYIPENWHGIPDALNPSNAYSIAKRAAEHLCILYSQKYGLHTVIARCFAFVGQDLPLGAHFAIGNFIRDALLGREIRVTGDGSPLRSYLDQRDLSHWLLTLLERGVSGQAYNVGSDQSVSIINLANLVRDVIAPDKPVRIQGKTIGYNERNIYIPSITKAKKELGLDVRVSLADAIRTTADAARRRTQ